LYNSSLSCGRPRGRPPLSRRAFVYAGRAPVAASPVAGRPRSLCTSCTALSCPSPFKDLSSLFHGLAVKADAKVGVSCAPAKLYGGKIAKTNRF